MNSWKRVLTMVISRARSLNEFKKSSVAQDLPGTDFLHLIMKDGVISNDMYEQLKRLAEDPSMDYEIIVR